MKTLTLKFALLLCFLLPSPALATVLFSEDYEVTLGNVDCTALAGPCTQSELDLVAKGWVHMDGASSSVHPSRFDIVSITGHDGTPTKALRLSYIGLESSTNAGKTAWTCDGCYEGFLIHNFPATNDYYERYWFKADKIDPAAYGGPVPQSGFTNGGGKQHYIFNANSHQPAFFNDWGQGGNFDFSGQAVSNAATMTCPTSPNGDGTGSGQQACNVYSNPRNNAVTMGVWHCLETHVGNGIVESWVDGVLKMQVSVTNWTPNGGWGQVEVYRQHGENYYRYEDDWVVSTTRVGCALSPSVAANLSTVPANSAITATVNGGPSNATDYIGLFLAADPSDNAHMVDWFYLNGSKTAPAVGVASATVNFIAPAAVGTYQFRFFSNNSFTLIASSNTFTVTSVATILPTITANTNTGLSTTITGTQDASNPMTNVRLCYGSNSGSPATVCPIIPRSSFAGWPATGSCAACQGIYTFTYPAGTDFECPHAQDSQSREDATAFVCTGVVPVLDTTPPAPPTGVGVQ